MNLAFNSMKRYICIILLEIFIQRNLESIHSILCELVQFFKSKPTLPCKVVHSLTKLFILWQSVAMSDTASNCLIKYYIVWFSVTLSDTALLRRNYRWQRNHSYTLQMFCQRSLWSSRSDYDKASQWNLNTKSWVRSSSTCNASSTFGWSSQLLPHD